MSGQLVYFEIPARDVGRSAGFYGDLLGWETAPWQGDYQTIEGAGVQGGLAPSEDAHPAIYFGVEDIERAVERVRELGGTPGTITEIPPVGRYVECRDDQGVRFSLFQRAA